MAWLPRGISGCGCEAGLGALREAPGFELRELLGDVCFHGWAVTILCLQPFFFAYRGFSGDPDPCDLFDRCEIRSCCLSTSLK